MIFTIGHTASYTIYLNSPVVHYKLGRRDDYEGGSVWKTREEAESHCPPGYSVYGVLADWDVDTVPSSTGSCHDLIRDSILVNL